MSAEWLEWILALWITLVFGTFYLGYLWNPLWVITGILMLAGLAVAILLIAFMFVMLMGELLFDVIHG